MDFVFLAETQEEGIGENAQFLLTSAVEKRARQSARAGDTVGHTFLWFHFQIDLIFKFFPL